MDTWTDRDERQAAARAEYERIMTTPSPDPSSAYIDAGVIGFVFGEMWRRGVLTARDRRLITLSCLGSTGRAFRSRPTSGRPSTAATSTPKSSTNSSCISRHNWAGRRRPS